MNREETLASLEHLAGYSRTTLELIAFEANRQVELLTAEVAALKAERDTYISVVAAAQQVVDTLTHGAPPPDSPDGWSALLQERLG